ncbi:MAG: PepSY domain-containing protein [Parvibaculum sp.]|uniref:PepSY domain-containing protein n=1 Tax=Parvibaculum sp. TaxID=2024848 RepID=UPI0032EBAB2D
MTRFGKTLLAGAASIALMASPALAEGDALQPGEPNAPGAAATDTMPEVDAVAQLQALGYTDIEPIDAQGDAGAEGQSTFTATNLDGQSVMVTLDTQSGTVIDEQPAD